MANPDFYPTPPHRGGKALGAPDYERFFEPTPDYGELIITHKFPDGGVHLSTTGDVPPQTYVFEYRGLKPVQAALLDAHHASAFGHLFDFSFVHPKTRLTISGVRYAEDGFVRSHERNRSWIQHRLVTLVRRAN